MVVLTPLGLLADGGAFGETGPGSLQLGRYGLKAIPNGLAAYNSLWDHAVLGGYGFRSGEHPALAYLLSAVVGILAVSLIVGGGYLATLALRRVRRDRLAGA
jgi:cobalt/nickel transport system permease protein